MTLRNLFDLWQSARMEERAAAGTFRTALADAVKDRGLSQVARELGTSKQRLAGLLKGEKA